MKKRSMMIVVVLLSVIQTALGQGTLKGKVTDGKDPLPYVNVALTKDGKLIGGAQTNVDGYYTIKPINPGTYDVSVTYVGFQKRTIKGVPISNDRVTDLDFTMVAATSELQSVEVTYNRPIFSKDASSSDVTESSSEIQRMVGRSAEGVTTRAAGVQGRDGQMGSVRGSRTDGTVTYIDGVKVAGASNLPKSTIREINVEHGGTPAKFENEEAFYRELKFNRPNSNAQEEPITQYEYYNSTQTSYNNYEYEEYDPIIENEFVGVLTTPLSTFSIDVDKASYSNIRRFFTQGARPPVNSVRLEEMVNYFNYDYPQPTGKDAFSITTEYTNCPWSNENKLLLVGIQGKKVMLDKIPATSLVFLIDVSGSMDAANKLPLVKQSLIMLVGQMRPIDKIGIAVYAGESGIALESTFCTPKNISKIISSIENLQAGGSTAGASGINLAYKMAADNFMKEGNNRIILCTDGDFNVGMSDDQSLVSLIEEKRKGGVFLSILGFGMGNYKDSKMEKLADKGNGNYAYIDNEQEAKRVLVEQYSATMMTIAKDVKIQIEFNPLNVKEYRLIGYENRALAAKDFENDAIDAGEIGSGASVTALYEIIPATQKRDSSGTPTTKYQKTVFNEDPTLNNELCNLKVRYKEPTDSTSKLVEKPVDKRWNAFENSSNNIRFAASVASFGMLIRFSKFVGIATFDSVYKSAKASAKGSEDRLEFLEIVKKAKAMYVK